MGGRYLGLCHRLKSLIWFVQGQLGPLIVEDSQDTNRCVSQQDFERPPLLSSCVVPPSVTTQLLGSGSTALQYGVSALLLCNVVHVTNKAIARKLCKVGH